MTTIASLATDLRNELLRTRALGDIDGVGAWTYLVTAAHALQLGSARRRAYIARVWAMAQMDARAGQAFELAADAAHERDMLTERLVQAGALTAADHLAAGASWEYDGAAIIVSRPGGETHRVVRGRCSCSASRFGRACWALDVVAELTPARVAA